jgi:hypothetical protein
MPSLLDAMAEVPNASQPLPQLLTSGQPGIQHFEALKAAGGRDESSTSAIPWSPGRSMSRKP